MFRQLSTAALVVLTALGTLTFATAQESEKAGGEKQSTNSIGMKLTLIPSGEFTMGSAEYDDEKPPHRVRITKPFYLGTYHVTVGQFRQFVNDSGHDAGPRWKAPGFAQTDERPVVCVSWDDAVAFCKWLSRKEVKTYRLPTEAEWEYACRAGTTTKWSFGDDEKDLGDYAWYDGNSGRGTHPVGLKRPNGFGLYDMHGNAAQWCADWYGKDYANSRTDDPTGPATGTFHVRRGGCWYAYARIFRSANRGFNEPGGRYNDLGFRVSQAPADK